jgi:precorrin-4 methylase
MNKYTIFLAALMLSPCVLLGDEKKTTVTVTNQSEDPIELSAEKLAKLPRAEVRVGNRVYSGVPISELLAAAGVIWEGHCSPLLTCYVIVEAADGYQVLFSVSEIDPNQRHKISILADRCDGRPLPKGEGPYETVEEDAKQHGRMVRHADKVTLVRAIPRSKPLRTARQHEGPGKLYLVGMGPGDAELVTLKAARVLKEADCIYCFDYLRTEVERYAPSGKITVAPMMLMGRCYFQKKSASKSSSKSLPSGKQNQACDNRAAGEEELKNFVARVRKLIAEGKNVVFADSGDPTMYCPWTWVVDEFADLHPAVVAGLSSFNAANAALKQSITKNGGSILVTPGDDLGSPDAHGRLKNMVVLFTHRMKFNEAVQKLAARYPGDTPIALVCEASYEREQVIYGTLATIREKVDAAKMPHLYLIYAGDGLTLPKASATAAK